MIIKIKANGHQFYSEITGRVMKWVETAEKFGDRYLQVPAVVIKTESTIQIVPLKQELYWFEIEVLNN